MAKTKRATVIQSAQPGVGPAWRPMLRAADRHQVALQRDVTRVLEARRDRLDLAALEAALARGDRAAAERAALAALPDAQWADLQAAPGSDQGQGDARVPGRPPAIGHGDPGQPWPTFQPRALQTPTDVVAGRLLDVAEDAANATRCAVRPTTDRAERARQAFKPATADIQRLGEANEGRVAALINGRSLDNNEAMDVIGTIGNRRYGVEVKTFVYNSNNKITVRKAAQARKLRWARKNRASLHTIVVDERDTYIPAQYSGTRFWYRRGTGSFRLEGMVPASTEGELVRLMSLTPRELARELRRLGIR